ncbi:MAG: hypothetical protein ACXIUM_08395 [Wenzhouxiangella sp.]
MASLRYRAGPIIACLLLAACASPGQRDAERIAPAQNADLALIAAALVGEYVSIRRIGDPGETVTLQVSPEWFGAGLALNLDQAQSAQSRRFRLELIPDASRERFSANFIPLQAQGNAGAACAMDFRLSAGRLVGQTDPATCRFQSGEFSVGLLKEMAFDGDRVLIADQLLLPDGTPLGEADRLSLGRAANFSGTLAVREAGAWRIARNLRLSSGGSLIEPLDAAGMSLGFLLDLQLVHSPEQDVPALRLQIVSEPNEQVAAEVWADLDSALMGLSLETLRLELLRLDGTHTRP